EIRIRLLPMLEAIAGHDDSPLSPEHQKGLGRTGRENVNARVSDRQLGAVLDLDVGLEVRLLRLLPAETSRIPLPFDRPYRCAVALLVKRVVGSMKVGQSDDVGDASERVESLEPFFSQPNRVHDHEALALAHDGHVAAEPNGQWSGHADRPSDEEHVGEY